MKYPVLVISLIVSLIKIEADKKELLCHHWVQFAFKKNGAVMPISVDALMAKECSFAGDDKYDETMYNKAFKASGKWFFNNDQTKMGMTIDNVNGQNFPGQDQFRNTNIVILKLTKDTLVYGEEAYYGKDRVYGHDDLYFVRRD